MDSFADKSLKDIVEEAAANSGSGVEVTANPVFSSPIDYVCQYEESCFEFLNRLSWIYGEWFYYDGQKTQFGKPDSIETVELVYEVHIKNMIFRHRPFHHEMECMTIWYMTPMRSDSILLLMMMWKLPVMPR